jgi:hypothetical protein
MQNILWVVAEDVVNQVRASRLLAAFPKFAIRLTFACRFALQFLRFGGGIGVQSGYVR